MTRQPVLRILLDSTYMLPILGIEVEDVTDVLVVLRDLRRRRIAEFYYTPFNIMEMLGKIAKTRYDYKIVATGLSLIEEEFRVTYPTTTGYMKALELRSRGFNDLIDLLLYTTSLTRDLLFLTRDYDLISYLRRLGEDTRSILDEKSFLEQYPSLLR